MIPCNACAAEQVRFIGEKQIVTGCVYCTAVSMLKQGLTKNPENLCGCYKSNPEKHLESHRDTKQLGLNFVDVTKVEELKPLDEITEVQEVVIK